ncbi:MAG: urease accessory UreF family protein, partial [Pseudomonadota bacterium]
SADEITIPLRLVRLISSQLPVGAFAYSRGLEYASEAGWVRNEAELRSWLFGTLEHSFAPLDGALFLKMMTALQDADATEFRRYDDMLLAARESAEMALEDTRMAQSLLKLRTELAPSNSKAREYACKTFPAAFALAVFDMDVSGEAGLHGLMWATCEAQVAAAIRLGLIGQSAGQRIMSDAPEIIAICARISQETPEDRIGNVSFMVAVSSALHETQYSRLFRS